MLTEQLIEEVAEAIFGKDNHRNRKWEDADWEVRENYRFLAKAALQASGIEFIQEQIVEAIMICCKPSAEFTGGWTQKNAQIQTILENAINYKEKPNDINK